MKSIHRSKQSKTKVKSTHEHQTDRPLSRRSVLFGAAPFIVGGASLFSCSIVAAQDRSTGNSSIRSRPQKIWSREYWANNGDIRLSLFRKRIDDPEQTHDSRPVLFLAHGSSVSARPTFDLAVPGHDDYSLMDKFAEFGFDVWTMDFQGYGQSSAGPHNSDIASGVQDLSAAREVVVRETGERKFHLYGESSGALKAGVFAMEEPHSVGRLVLVSFTWTGQGSPTLAKRSESADLYRTHSRRPRDREMIRSIFTRDKPGTSDPAVAEAMADAELKYGDSVPSGTYLDMTTKLPVVDPLRLKVPVLIARGEYDGIATEDDILNFFKRLPVPDRELVILPGAAHSIALGINRRQFWHVLRSFLDMPAPFTRPKD